jgi:hypothetical protein
MSQRTLTSVRYESWPVVELQQRRGGLKLRLLDLPDSAKEYHQVRADLKAVNDELEKRPSSSASQ